MSPEKEKPGVDPNVVNSAFVAEQASSLLRICCYGSSSAKTPEKYMVEARSLGYILARRGHTLVNGAGSFGCMAAMNDGAEIGNGHIVGVIHEMFVVDGSDWIDKDRDGFYSGGAHKVFHNSNGESQHGPIREILVAGGEDLQERKRLLVEGANGLVVLPGGPGTWDELWEMACARNIGLTDLPIVCVNVDGYYENFREMLNRGYKDELIKLKPHEVINFEPTAEKAVRWLEEQAAKRASARPKIRRRDSALRSSFMAPPVGGWSWFRQSFYSWQNGILVADESILSWRPPKWAVTFVAGVAIGAGIVATGQSRRRL